MKIGIDARMMGKKQATGIGNYIEQIVTRILDMDNENKFVIFVHKENRDILKKYENNKNITIITSTCHWYSFCEQIKFCTQVHFQKLDIMHYPQFNVPLLQLRPYIVTIHDVTPLRFPGHKMKSGFRRFIFEKVFTHAVKNAKKILTVSEYTKQELTRLYPSTQSKIEVIHLGVEKHFEDSVKYDKIREVKEYFGITKPYFLYVGAWRNHKNILGLLQAFAYLKNELHVDAQLVLGGAPNTHYQEPIDYIKSLPEAVQNDIITPGFIDDAHMPALYADALAYTVVSFEEGFGLNGLEAMATNTPVLASRNASLPEIYQEAALYCDPYNSQDIAEKMSLLYHNDSLRLELQKKGAKVVKNYSWDTAAKNTHSIYTSL